MHAGKRFTFKTFIFWTRRNIYKLAILATIPTILYEVFGLEWLAIPWQPVALVGTAAAFIAGFKNTQTYNRLWEARQIWGGIINDSRAFGVMTRDFIINKENPAENLHPIHQRILYRHFAWMTALRYQLRTPEAWENQDKPYFKEFRTLYSVPEWEEKLEDVLAKYLSSEEQKFILARKNRATQLLSLQSEDLRNLKNSEKIADFPYVELEKMIKEFYGHQGKAERIKKFPYPRQFASINMYFIVLFCILVPFGLLNEFAKVGEHFVWLTIPFSVLVGWVFTSLEQVGESTENPFEGGANDVPMAQISRTIEIDLREILGETELPPAITPVNEILM